MRRSKDRRKKKEHVCPICARSNFKNWLTYQWHVTDAHPLFRDKKGM
jgi:hypothetical protein